MNSENCHHARIYDENNENIDRRKNYHLKEIESGFFDFVIHRRIDSRNEKLFYNENLNQVCNTIESFEKTDQYSDITCPICLDIFSHKSIVVKLPCEHLIHQFCSIEYFMRKSNSCPLCRKQLCFK